MFHVKHALRDCWPVAVGLFPLGVAFGLVITQAGFAWWWATIFSIVIYAGSMEFLAVSLISGGVGVLSATFAGFLVNFRHIFYGLTFPRSVIKSRLARLYSTYALTDECYALTAGKKDVSSQYLLSVQVICQLAWVLSGTLGALAGAVVPTLPGFEFALTALFVVLALDAFRASRDLSLIVTALGSCLVGNMALALCIFFGLLLLRFRFERLDELLTWRLP